MPHAPLPSASYIVPGTFRGLVQPGNIDLNSRPVVKNPDGTISTVRSMSFTPPDSPYEVLVPTVIGNKVVSEQEAMQHYMKTGQHLGMFKSPQAANRYAVALHLAQAKQYAGRG